MINIKNTKFNLALLGKGIGIACITITNVFLPLDAVAQKTDCVNFWTNPSTGENECFNGQMNLIAEPIPVSYNSLIADRYNVGGQQILVPSPENYVRVTQAMDKVYRLHRAAKDPYNKLLASYIPQSEVDMAIQGEFPTSTKGFYLKMPKMMEQELVSPHDFAQMKHTVKTQNKEIIASNKDKIEKIVNESGNNINKELGIDVAVDVVDIIPLDMHYESENAFAYSMYIVNKVSSGGEHTEYAMAATATLINVSGKIVSLYSIGEQADLEWTRKASRDWAKKAIASNL